jgi:hypothetical protein
MEFHPLADLFPLLTDEATEALGDDMLEFGQREPIWTYDGKILDGRNRYRACLLKGIEPRFAEFRGADPVAFVASANLHRRHLDESQRAVIAARLATMRQGARTDLSPAGRNDVSQAKAATLLNVGKRSVERGRVVLDHGVPDLVHAVEKGDVSVSAGAGFAKSNPPSAQSRLIAKAGSVPAAVKAADVKKKADRAEAAAKAKPRSKPNRESRITPPADHLDVHEQQPGYVEMLARFAEFCKTHHPATVAGGVLPHEVVDLLAQVAFVDAWLGDFVVLLERHKRAMSPSVN